MDCVDFVTGSPWFIRWTAGATVQPFVQGNSVCISDASDGTFNVTVWVGQVPDCAGRNPPPPFTGFTCVDKKLQGTVNGRPLAMRLLYGPPQLLIGDWDVQSPPIPEATTSGSWAGEEGGGGRDDA